MSTTETWAIFLSGVLAAGYAVATVYFLRFWTASRDRLFLFFAAAFALLTVQRTALAVTRGPEAEVLWLYIVRLGAFGLILVGIVDKNRSSDS